MKSSIGEDQDVVPEKGQNQAHPYLSVMESLGLMIGSRHDIQLFPYL